MAGSHATRADDEDGVLFALTRLFQHLIDHSDAIQAEFREKLQALRVLVVGKAGCGKTTLIRLVVGEDGIVQGEVDMWREWRWKPAAADQASITMVIHDSNGIDGRGEERKAEIKAFLDRHVEFWDRVHLVWYVFRAVDNRVLDDGGLLEMVLQDVGYGDRELQLIMTHCDVAKAIGGNMEERVLTEVVGRASDEEMRRSLKQSTVRLGNRARWDRRSGKLMIDDSGDGGSVVELRRLMSEKTKQLMSENKLRRLWAKCEASNTKEKLEASIELILRLRRRQAAISSVFGAVPLLHTAKLTASLGHVTRELTNIWNASSSSSRSDRLVVLPEDIAHAFLDHQLTRSVSRTGRWTAIWAVWLGASLAYTTFMGVRFLRKDLPVGLPKASLGFMMSTTGVPFGGSALDQAYGTAKIDTDICILDPNACVDLAVGLPKVSLGFMGGILSTVTLFGGSALHQACRTAKIFMVHSLLVLGALIYAKTHYDKRGGTGVKANTGQQLVKEFMASKWAKEVTSIAEGYGSLTDTFFHGKRQQERLLSETVSFFEAVALRSVDDGAQTSDTF